MSSRDKILATVKSNQPAPRELPEIPVGGAFPGVSPGVSPGVAPGASSGASSDVTPSVAPGASSGASSDVNTSVAPGVAPGAPDDLAAVFISALEAIGGTAFIVSGFDRIATILHEKFPSARRVLSACPQLAAFAAAASSGFAPSAGAVSSELAPSAGATSSDADPHLLEDVDLAILPAHFAVAENGACWITESQMGERVLPFITQHLALVVMRQAVVANMHQAYERIAAIESAAIDAAAAGNAATRSAAIEEISAGPQTAGPGAATYGFATFIAGPSKTADIEQSLVLGAHGPTSLTVFLLDDQLSDAGFY